LGAREVDLSGVQSMTKFFMTKIIFLSLLVSLVTAQAAYAQSQTAFSTAVKLVGWYGAGNQKHVTGEQFIRTELFFGTAMPDSGKVNRKKWDRFLENEVTPRFPDGLTVLTGIGQFRDSNGRIVQEKSIRLILLYPLRTLKSSSEKIEQIREVYKQAFQQQSVLRVDDRFPVWVSF
jgi:hypothetical protein